MRICVLILCFACCHATDMDYLNSAIKQAIDKELWEYRQWKTLLHYERGHSQIDDERFFYAEDGFFDAKKELIATLKAMYKPLENIAPPTKPDLTQPSTHPFDTHALCRFPARVRFLKEHLLLKNLPQNPCVEYHALREYINPKQLSIVFPSAYLNSPASLFGHTFLLFEGDFKSRLLAYALNFAARADEENGFLFAIRGVFGMYQGYYSMLPYYESLKIYKDTESRDIWEFQLNFSDIEALRAFEHTWELREIYSDYYFFDENCSYNLLWILESARPGLEIRKAFPYYVMPLDTIFALHKKDLIAQSSYRPSKRNVINAYTKQLQFSDIHAVRELANGNFNLNITDKHKASLLLETALELNEYHYINNKISKDSYTNNAHELAKARSKLGRHEPLPIKTPASPLLSHNSTRVFVGMIAHNNKNAIATELRIAYHDISESNRGILSGTQIEFLRLMLSYSPTAHKWKLEDFALISLASFAPISKLFAPISYRFTAGATQILGNKNLPFMRLGAGGSVDLPATHWEWYGYYLLEGMLSYSHHAIGSVFNTIGISSNAYPLNITTEASNIIHSTKTIENSLQLSLHWNLTQNFAFFSKITTSTWHNTAAPKSQHSQNIAILGIRAYF